MLSTLNMTTLEYNVGALIRAKLNEGNINTLNIIKLSKDPRVNSYMKGKVSACEEYGVLCKIHEPKDKKELLTLLDTLAINPNEKVIIQTPIDEEIFGDIYELSELVPREQDVDGFEFPLIRFRQYKTIPQFLNDSTFSPTAKGVLAMLYAGRMDKHRDPMTLRGETVTVIGTGLTSGLPIANACMALGATVYTACSSTPYEDLKAMVGDSTIVIGCSGIAHIVDKDLHSVRENVMYINVGMSRENGKMLGDINQEDVLQLENTMYANPTFGSTGRLTCLFVTLNTVI